MSLLCSEPLSRAFHFRQRESQRPCNDKPAQAHLVPHSTSTFIFCFSLLQLLWSSCYSQICKLLGLTLAVQWLRLPASSAGAVGLIPGQRTKISHVALDGQKNPPKTNKQKTCKCLPRSLWIFLELLPYLQNPFPMALTLTFLKSLLRSHILKEFSPDHHM